MVLLHALKNGRAHERRDEHGDPNGLAANSEREATDKNDHKAAEDGATKDDDSS